MKNSDTKPTPIEVQKYLKGMNYPASKEDIIDCAEQNNAPEEVIDTLNELDDNEYESPTQITQQMAAHIGH